MKSGNEILETFESGKFEALEKLTSWTFEELEELKKRYQINYDGSSTNSTYSIYIKYRIDLLKEAITVKAGNEEQAWDYLS